MISERSKDVPSPSLGDYSLTGKNASLAIELGLAEADWYQCKVPRDAMRELLVRRDGPAIRDTLLWFALILGTGYATWALWGSWWALLPYAAYAVLYGSSSDSRWHESSHGTAFKTDWMNNALYEISSFMVMRESVVWRWSHTRHHSDTIIVGRDPEISFPRPPNIFRIALGWFGLTGYPVYFKSVLHHATGRISEAESTFIPETEFSKVIRNARLYLLIYTAAIVAAMSARSILPLLLIGLPAVFGSWLMNIYGSTQHAGLAENVLDHRLNCRTMYVNLVHRYLYWNMNYHVEHHMFPLVPYHALPRLHEIIKDDCPPAYQGLWGAWKEIIPTLLRQRKEPAYFVRRPLPASKASGSTDQASAAAPPVLADAEGWVPVCPARALPSADVIRFDHGKKTYAIYRDAEQRLYATDGICTHGNTHLADGLVKGNIIECPKHNGRFFLHDGSPARAPVCRALATYPVEEKDGQLRLNIMRAGGAASEQKTFQLRVVSNRNVATFIKELVLEPIDAAETIAFTPGDYLQLDIPPYEEIRFSQFDIPEPYAAAWRDQDLFDLIATNAESGRRNNYSLASNQQLEKVLRFNVRIAIPPPGSEWGPGVGSAYVFQLKPGDVVSATGPFGDFHPKQTQREMVYIGGGAGMAPLRAHLSHLFETEDTARKVSFWYGARSAQELFYADYFEQIAQEKRNFSFHVALSSVAEHEVWEGERGFIHDVVLEKYLRQHANVKAVEFYLCGPPPMIAACNSMLAELGVPPNHIAYDEF